MKKSDNKAPQAGFNVHDALYIIFKHKWKIIILTLVGLAAAGAMYHRINQTPTFETKAQLMVRYVVEGPTIDPDAEARMNSGGMFTQVALLNSVDTAAEVARDFGPERLVPHVKEPTPLDAAGVVMKGLTVRVPPGSRRSPSNLLEISYRNADPELAVGILEQVIKTYFRRHLELHRPKEAFEQVQKQTEQARSALVQTEEEINRLKEKEGVLNIASTMAQFEERRRMIKENKDEAEAELAEQKAKVQALEASLNAAKDGDKLAELEADAENTQDFEAQRSRLNAIEDYRSLGERLDMLQRERNRLLLTKRENNPMISGLDRQIKSVRRQGLELVEDYPELAGLMTGETQLPVTNIEDEKAMVSALEARLNTVLEQEEGLDAEVARLSALGFKLQALERRRQVEDDNYRFYHTSLEKARIDETLDYTRIPNISVIQNPSPPVRSIDEKSMKIMMGLAGSGLAIGLALAFLIEMVIDRKVTRSTEIETRLQLPLMMSIPWVRSRDNVEKLIGCEPGLELLGDAGDVILPPVPSGEEFKMTSQESEHFILPYTCAIRDRVLFNFEVNNITHKPKLIAVTGLTAGAGTSTVAAGLAKAFAESEDRKVLYVDLNPSMNGPAITGRATDSLVKALRVSQQEGFHRSKRSLYYASAPTRRSEGSSAALAPTKLHELMPYLSASEFDYIIFDMPPVDPTSPTQAMAGFMDKVLLVLDAGRTSKEALQWGYSQLANGKSDVSCVYNKAKSHAPRWVEGAA